jgi:hypothetical protein
MFIIIIIIVVVVTVQQLGFVLCLLKYNFLNTLGICTWLEFYPQIQKLG